MTGEYELTGALWVFGSREIGSLKIDQRPCVSSRLIGFSPSIGTGKEQLFGREEKREKERERQRLS